MELVKHVLGDFLDRALLGVYQYIGLPVKWLPRTQELADFIDRRGILQQRTMALATHSFPDELRRRPKADYQSMLRAEDRQGTGHRVELFGPAEAEELIGCPGGVRQRAEAIENRADAQPAA